MIRRRVGTSGHSSSFASRFGTRAWINGRLSRPRHGLYARSVTAPTMRTLAFRWDKAAAICGAPKAGFKGTNMAPNLKTAYVSVANSGQFPSLTATRSPFLTPRDRRECAKEFDLRSSSSYERTVSCACGMRTGAGAEKASGLVDGDRHITAGRSPYLDTIDAKCSGIVSVRSGGCEGVEDAYDW